MASPIHVFGLLKCNLSVVPLLLILLNNSGTTSANTGRSIATESSYLTGLRAPVVSDTIPSDEEISETGILKQLDGAGYPIAILTIEFPKQQLTEQFTINLEEVRSVPLTTLSALVGKTISFRYTTEQTNALLDIEVGGRFLLDADAGVVTKETSKVTGVLGADEITTGDLPGLLTITAADGEITEFPFFITSELLEVNGTTVTAFYEERTTNTIKAITIAK